MKDFLLGVLGILICLSCSKTIHKSNTMSYDSNGYPKVNLINLGAKADGVHNDYYAFQEAVQIINEHGGGTLEIPKGTYYIKNYNSGNEKYDLIYKNLDYLVIEGNHSEVLVNGDFNRVTTRVGSKNKFSNVSALTPFLIKDSKNITIQNLKIKGGIDQTKRDEGVRESSGYLIQLKGCENVLLESLNLQKAQTDGLCISASTKESKNVKANNIVSKYNARMGLTIAGLIQGEFRNCTFSHSGQNINGSYGAHDPQAGIDVEPNNLEFKVHDIEFINCKIMKNKGSQILLSHTTETKDIVFNKCYVESADNSRRFALIGNAKSYAFMDCEFELKNTSLYPVWHKGGVKATFRNCLIKSSSEGINLRKGKNPSFVTIDQCKFKYTGNSTMNTYMPNIRMVNVNFTNNTIDIPAKYLKKGKASSIIENVDVIENLKTNFPKAKNIITSKRSIN